MFANRSIYYALDRWRRDLLEYGIKIKFLYFYSSGANGIPILLLISSSRVR